MDATTQAAITQAAGGAAAAAQSRARPRRAAAALRRDLARIRAAYTRLVYGRQDAAGAYEWLFDNFYIFEREGRLCVRALESAPPLPADGARVPLAAADAMRFCAAVKTEVGAQSIAAYLSALSEVRELESAELAAFPLLLRAALIARAADALQGGGEETAVATAVRALVFLTTFDFSEILERQSAAERILSQDPAGAYPHMDERSRALYRERLAVIARRRGISESEAARRAVALAQNGETPRARHVGVYIVEQDLERTRPHARGRAYLAVLWVLPAALAVALGLLLGVPWAAALLWLPLWEVLHPLVDTCFLRGVQATLLPRMELEGVIPEEAGTLAVISALLAAPQAIDGFAKRIEQFYMSNGRGNILFGVLADLREAGLPEQPGDRAVIGAARRAVEKLNRKYGPHFCLFLRERRFSPTQGGFSGWERKRGAILELARFIRGASDTSITATVGDLARVRRVKYLITLDADTGLVMDSAAEMVGAAMHPLNAPVVDEAAGVVRQGYGILAPRMGVDLESAGATPFSRVMAGCGGVTAYDNAAGDIYQDLFGAGIFAGKGLIDVEAFARLDGGRLPEGRVLSHDILEGAFLRAGFLSDVELTDGFPADPVSWFARLHRWLRGDWQNVGFLFPRIPAEGGGRRRSPLAGLSRFQLWDNLRRSLTPVLAFACLVAAAFCPPWPAAVLTAAAVLAAAGAGLWGAMLGVAAGGPSALSRKYHCRVLPQAGASVAQGVLGYLFLPIHAFTAADAAVRALWRLRTGKRLLAWRTFAESGRDGARDAFWRFFPALAAGLLFLFNAPAPAARVAGAFFICAPFIAWLSGREARPRDDGLRPREKETLQSYAAAMWRYYEDYANEDEHWLPPDNVQEAPVHAVAHRTSPTNIGLALLATLAARDFGLIDSETLCKRVEGTLDTIERLEKWRGHLYNWYDTRTLAPLHPAFVSTVDSGNLLCCMVALGEGLRDYGGEAGVGQLRARVFKLADETDMAALYNRHRKLFHIGYDVEQKRLEEIYYDLLMSEARLASYYAVARRVVPKRHWGALGRTLTRQGGYAGPVSWTGTMFEYLMPHLLLPVYEDSLAAETLRFVLYCQKRRVRGHGVPWGVSESGFYAFDAALNYQYAAHGVQKLALKRGMDDDLVVSPYSTFLALPFDPAACMQNLHRLETLGMLGRCGFYEAVDFTPGRTNGRGAVVKSYMAHHVGMSIVACANALKNGVMQERFMQNGSMRAARDLLQEKVPAGAVVFNDVAAREVPDKPGRPFVREVFEQISPASPRVHVIANGEQTMVLTDCGASFSLFRGLDLTKRPDDLLRRPAGVFALARVGNETVSATAAPDYTGAGTVKREAAFLPNGALYTADAGLWSISMRACLHGRMPVEARRVEIISTFGRARQAKLLFYLEPLLAKTADEAAHPAFSRLFLRAVYRADTRVLLFARRPRGKDLPAFLAVGLAEMNLPFTFELERTALLVRPEGIASLAGAMDVPFSDKTGAVPECAACLRLTLPLPARGKAAATLLLAAANTEAEAEARLIQTRREGFHAMLHTAAGKNGDGIESRLSALILPQLLFSAPDGGQAEAKAKNHLGQPGLWSIGISGDEPIVLFCYEGPQSAEQLEAYVRTHRALRLQGIVCDLAVVYREGGEYTRAKAEGIRAVLRTCGSDYLAGARGGVHAVNLSHHPGEIETLLRAAACHIAHAAAKPAFRPFTAARILPARPAAGEKPEDAFYAGGFRGHRVLIPHEGEQPPAPWCHILANHSFGTLVSDRALGFTWALNAHENKLTPWLNDPVADNRGELLLLRAGGRIYDVCAGAHVTFGDGFARYAAQAEGMDITAQVRVPGALLAKTVTLTLENRARRVVDIEAVYAAEPVLAAALGARRHLVIWREEGAALLRNPWAVVSGVGVMAASEEAALLTGRAALLAGDWSPREEDAPDACAALLCRGTLPPGGRWSVTFVLGWGACAKAALAMARMALQTVRPQPAPAILSGHAGNDFTEENGEPADGIEVQTPDAALDRLLGVLPRQIVGARILGRTGFYQCGGAWGFRDQLQDCGAALLFDAPLARRHILRCAARQFAQGDVMHWWHQLPPRDGGARGVRTRVSDDMLWLPYTVCDYLDKTGDESLLSVPMPYLDGPALEPGEHDRYFVPTRADERDTVYGHCVRAIERASTAGAHGLPLFGAGDWNDGMNLVGAGGRGESVWLAMFLACVCERFVPLCRMMKDEGRAQAYEERARALRRAVDDTCWDGGWYLRGFYDDGAPLGGNGSDECRIDVLPQAWAALAGMPDKGRVDTALDSMLRLLADERLRLVRLFTPAFDHGAHNPGYIRSYPPGIRENGGQYTHGAVWGAMALFTAGRADDGWRLLRWLNPVSRAQTEDDARVYRLEPYAMAGDISTNAAIEGRGGWSLYTGAAGWYYRTAVEQLLGLRIGARALAVRPSMPGDWPGYTARLRLRGGDITLAVSRGEEKGLLVDGRPAENIPLDGRTHEAGLVL